MSLLRVKNLQVSFPDGKVQGEVLKGISFSMEQGEILGIVGESGSGKSMTSLAVMNLLPSGSFCRADEMVFEDKNLLELKSREWEEIRGNRISMVFQEPMTSLNPVLTIEKQVKEVLLLHQKGRRDRSAEREKVLRALEEAGLKNASGLLKKYPHQLSGGMRQRVMIAMAMLAGPKLLIADEPTTALDAQTQDVILSLLKYYRKEYGTAILFISHDLKVVAELCDRVLVMNQGEIIEEGKTSDLFSAPKEDYTKKLLAAARGTTLFTEKKVQGEPLLEIRNGKIQYTDVNFFGAKQTQEVIADVSFSLYRGETLGLVGESGSGKSTISKAITGLLSLEEGEVVFAPGVGRPQMVFQDPYGSLNPAKKIGWILEEPLKIKGKCSKKERKRLVIEALKGVELEESHADRYVRELSGGQRQRVAIAAALIQKPDIVILDEPVSALDVTVQEQILNLLARLKKEHDISYLFISHDKDVVRRFCDRVLVLRDGEVREEGMEEKHADEGKEEVS